MSMEETTNPTPMRASAPLGTLLFRFIGLLALAVTVLALVWSQ